MLGSILKKKLSDEKVANIFINALMDTVDNGFPEIVSLINEDPAFINSPNLSSSDNGPFSLIILVANLSTLESTFDADQADKVEKIIFKHCEQIYGIPVNEFKKAVRDCQYQMSRINHPSKNVVYAMSKSFFVKYDLNQFQDEYFKRLQVPNPLFLKRMDEIMANFMWDWDVFMKKFRLNI